MSQLLVFRHAPVLEKGLCYGRFDPPVAEVTGELDESIGALHIRQNNGERFSLFSSPARRCLQVAQRLSEELDVAPSVSPHIAELSMGQWEGRPYSELESEPAFEYWMSNWQTAAPPGGETTGQLEARVKVFLNDLRGLDNPIVVSHAGVIRCLRVVLEGKDWVEAMNEPVPYLNAIKFHLTSS